MLAMLCCVPLTTQPDVVSIEKPVGGTYRPKRSFALAFPTEGDMDVPGKQLLDGSMFCTVKLQYQREKVKKDFSFAGSSTQVDDGGIAKLRKITERANFIIGETGMNFCLQSFSDEVLSSKIHLFPIDGSSPVRALNNKNAIFFRPTYQQELRALVDYIVGVRRQSKIAILYESGGWGSALYEELLAILAKRNIMPLKASRYAQNSVNVSRAVKDIVGVAPNVVFCLAKPRPAYMFIGRAVAQGMDTALFVGLSPTLSIQYPLKKSRGIDLITTSVVPSESSNLELVAAYKEFFGDRITGMRSNPFYLESFLYMKLLSEALDVVPAAATHPAALIQHFESFKDKMFMGLPLSFDPVTRSLATKLWIVPGVEKPWIEVALKQ